MEETELRDRLHRLADRTAPPVRDGEDLVHAVTIRLRARRRQQRTLAAVAVALAVVLVAVPIVVSGIGEHAAPAGPASSAGVYTTPTRGDLAGDADFVEGVRRLPWTTGPAGDDVPEPPLETRHVVYASTVPGARWALVVGASPTALPPEDGVDPADLDERTSLAIAWFTGSPDATAGAMSLRSVPRIAGADEPAALSHLSTGVTVVVGAPGDRIELSRLVSVRSDGAVIREYTLLAASQGIAVARDVPVEASTDRVTRYRLTRDGTVFSGVPDTYADPGAGPPAVEPARLRPAPGPAPGDAALTVAIDEVLSRSGMPASTISFTVVWAGDLPARDGGTVRFTLLAAQFTGGGLHIIGGLGWDVGTGSTAVACGSETRPAGTPLDEQVFVVRCDSDSGSWDGVTDDLVVVGPPGAAIAQVVDESGELLGRFPLTDGMGVVPALADLVTVQVLDSEGRLLDSRAPMGHAPLGG